MLELALAAKQFGQRPSLFYGLDPHLAEPALLLDFDLLCSLRLMWWDAYVAKKQAEAMKEAAGDGVAQPRQLQLPDGTLLPIPEYQN